MRQIFQPPRTWMTMCFLAVVTVATVGSPIWAAESNPWQSGKYRDFTPEAPTPDTGTGTTVGALGPALKLAQTTVHRPRVNPGGLAALRAQYTVVAPAGPIDVKETRTIRFNGTVLATLTKVASRANGFVGSEYQLKIPASAAEGWYTVTTAIERAQSTTRAATREQANTVFYVEPAGTPAPAPAAAEHPRPGDEGVKIRLWADKSQYKIGEMLTLSFETNRDAYVTLVNVGTSGDVTILFPNRFSAGNAVKGQTTYAIPRPDDDYELTLNGPTGIELIYALVTLKPVTFVETDFSRTPQIFPSVTRSTAVLTRDINIVAKQTPLKEQARAMLELEVLPQ